MDKKTVNILFHSNLFKNANGEYICKEVFADYFNKYNAYQINLISPINNKKEFFHTTKLSKKITVYETPKNIFKKIIFYTRILRKTEKNLIFMPTFSNALYCLILVLFRKKYIIYHGIDWSYNEKVNNKNQSLLGYIRFFLSFSIDSIVSNKSSFILTAGKQIRDKYKNFKPETIETQPIIGFENIDNSQLLENDKFNVLYVGSLEKRKGIFDLLHVARYLKDSNIVFNIIGGGSDNIQKKLNNFCIQNNLVNTVNFIGYKKNGNDLFNYYRSSHAFILPSYSEGMPRVLYEAMYFKVPIVSTNINGIPYLLKDGYNAFLVKPGDINSMKNGILQLKDDKNLREKFIQNSYPIIKKIIKEPAFKQHQKILDRL